MQFAVYVREGTLVWETSEGVKGEAGRKRERRSEEVKKVVQVP